MKTIYNSLKNSGGATLSVNHYSNATMLKFMTMNTGYQVSIEDLITIPVKYVRLTMNDLEWSEYLKLLLEFKSKDIREYSGAVCVGLWIDNEILYIDISQYLGDLDLALKLGYKNNQKAIFDWSKKESIYLD